MLSHLMLSHVRNLALASCLVLGTGGAAFAQAAGGAGGGERAVPVLAAPVDRAAQAA